MGGLSTEEKVALINRIVTDRKALEVIVIDMREASSITDYFLICSGGSERQVRAIADAYRDGHWILMDYGDVIVHVFSQETREFYDLERLWTAAPRIDLSGETTAFAPPHGATVG
jgi:ribosome-associated protein